jgi:hypothetical protein
VNFSDFIRWLDCASKSEKLRGFAIKLLKTERAPGWTAGLFTETRGALYGICQGRRGTGEIWPSDPFWTTQIRSARGNNWYAVADTRSKSNGPNSTTHQPSQIHPLSDLRFRFKMQKGYSLPLIAAIHARIYGRSTVGFTGRTRRRRRPWARGGAPPENVRLRPGALSLLSFRDIKCRGPNESTRDIPPAVWPNKEGAHVMERLRGGGRTTASNCRPITPLTLTIQGVP